jgi:hypothetical protein
MHADGWGSVGLIVRYLDSAPPLVDRCERADRDCCESDNQRAHLADPNHPERRDAADRISRRIDIAQMASFPAGSSRPHPFSFRTGFSCVDVRRTNVLARDNGDRLSETGVEGPWRN